VLCLRRLRPPPAAAVGVAVAAPLVTAATAGGSSRDVEMPSHLPASISTPAKARDVRVSSPALFAPSHVHGGNVVAGG